MSKKRIWIIAYHPQQIVRAIAVNRLLKRKFKICLIISVHKYWSKRTHDFLKKEFEKTFLIIPPKRPKKFDLYILFSWFLLPTLKARKQIKNLPIKREDYIIGLGGCWSIIENMVISKYKQNKRIFLGTLYKYEHDKKNRHPKKIF